MQVVLPEVQKLRQTIEVHETAEPLVVESAASSRHVSGPSARRYQMVVNCKSPVGPMIRRPDRSSAIQWFILVISPIAAIILPEVSHAFS